MSTINSIHKLAQALGEQLKAHTLQLTVAESCTGGSLAAELTAIPGSSQWFDRGFVTYSNHAKKEVLGVSEQTLHFDGAVSEATVRAMAEGAVYQSDAHLSVAISGIAGPDGGTKDKPVGTVWIAWAGAKQSTKSTCYTFDGDRIQIREAAVLEALKGLIKRAKAHQAPEKNTPRYFFALWPDERTQKTLDQNAEIMTQAVACTRSPAENLHLTLNYLGALTPAQYSKIKKLNCPISPFELKLTKAAYCSQNQFAYFEPLPSDSLNALHAFLNQHLLEQGFKPERRAFKPHITLARDYTHTLDACILKPIHWFAHELCLVQSIPHPNHPSQYQIIERTPLTLKTC